MFAFGIGIAQDYATAQDFFLASSRPITALEMRRDLLHWEQSLKLARTLAKGQIPYVPAQLATFSRQRSVHFSTQMFLLKGTQNCLEKVAKIMGSGRYISRAYGQQLEFKGEFSLALAQFEKALIDERQAAAAAMMNDLAEDGQVPTHDATRHPCSVWTLSVN